MAVSLKCLVVLVACGWALTGCSKSSHRITNPPIGGENHPPSILAVRPTPADVAAGGVAILVCRASDPDGDPLSFTWTAAVGTVTGSDSTAQWRAPDLAAEVSVKVVVRDGRGGADSATVLVAGHVNPSNRILVDASREGGVWWFPQSEGTGFSQAAPHQGKALADYMRSQGFQVDELPRTVTISDSLLNQYDRVIIAGSVYSDDADIQKYLRFIDRPTSLVLIGEYLRANGRNPLAERLGIHFAGTAFGNVTRFAAHPITQGATPFFFNAGAVVIDTTSNPRIQFLGWLESDAYVDLNGNGTRDPDEPAGMPVMGLVQEPKSKVFFLGELNGLEGVPQPLVSNLVAWAFQGAPPGRAR